MSILSENYESATKAPGLSFCSICLDMGYLVVAFALTFNLSAPSTSDWRLNWIANQLETNKQLLKYAGELEKPSPPPPSLMKWGIFVCGSMICSAPIVYSLSVFPEGHPATLYGWGVSTILLILLGAAMQPIKEKLDNQIPILNPINRDQMNQRLQKIRESVNNFGVDGIDSPELDPIIDELNAMRRNLLRAPVEIGDPLPDSNQADLRYLLNRCLSEPHPLPQTLNQ